MGKGTDLWDDSALINAFDHAMATYKAMHKESYLAKPHEKEKDTSESNQDEVAHSESSTRRQEEHASGESNLLKDVTETCMPCHKDVATSEGLESQEENLGANMCTKESNSYLPEFPVVTAETNYSNDQQTSDYNNLLKKYYDLEGQKQQLLWQLQQANYWNCQNPDQYGESQAEQVLPNNASENFQQSPCSLCSHLHSTAAFIPTSACVLCSPSFGGFYCCPQISGCQGHVQSGVCSVGTSCSPDLSKQTSDKDDKAIRIGMMVTEKVLSSVKNQISQDSTAFEEKKKGKEEIVGECKSSGGINPETDLADVLSAWYSAGFLTGRYISEQSRRKASQ